MKRGREASGVKTTTPKPKRTKSVKGKRVTPKKAAVVVEAAVEDEAVEDEAVADEAGNDEPEVAFMMGDAPEDDNGAEGAAGEEAAVEGPTGVAANPTEMQRSAQRKRWINRQRVLVIGARGITERARHLMLDMRTLMPHSKTDCKLDRKDNLTTINELCDLKNCNNSIFLEMRRKQDMYMWMSKVPEGPSAKFHVQDVHTMDELKMTGNTLRGSRPLLAFDSAFETSPHMRLLKELFMQIFGTPNRHPKSKPFFDRVLSIAMVDGRICVRNYQMVFGGEEKTKNTVESLQEIGPRFSLQPIRIFEGSFGGETLYENPEYITPAQIRRQIKGKKTEAYRHGRETKDANKEKVLTHLQMEKDPLANDIFD